MNVFVFSHKCFQETVKSESLFTVFKSSLSWVFLPNYKLLQYKDHCDLHGNYGVGGSERG